MRKGKTMKKIVLFLSVLLIAITAKSQEIEIYDDKLLLAGATPMMLT